MDWNYITSVIPRFIDATWITLLLAFWGVLFAFIIGFIGSIAITYRIKVLHPIYKIYIQIARNTPLLIQLFFLYFGLSKIGIQLSGFTCGIIGLAFLGGAYMTETLRAGLQAVSKTQQQAAISLGMNPVQVFGYITLPQAISIALPSIGANLLFLAKETSVVSAIAIAELMFVAKDLIGMDYKTNESLFLLVIFYLLILSPISVLISYLEKRQRSAQYGH